MNTKNFILIILLTLSAITGKSQVALGVFPGNNYGNPLWDTGLLAIKSVNTMANRKMAFVNTFVAWADSSGYASFGSIEPGLNAYHKAGYDVIVTWEEENWQSVITDTSWTLTALLRGKHDQYIQQYAQAAAAWKNKLYIRLFHEMNGNWTNWSYGVNGNTALQMKEAWIHVINIFRQEKATNVKFIWCPNVKAPVWTDNLPLDSIYPGDAYVDWIALDGYNWGGSTNDYWYSFDTIYHSTYNEILSTLSRIKPIMVAEVGCDSSHSDWDTSTVTKAEWIAEMMNVVPEKYPYIKAVSYFNSNQDGAAWAINTSPSSTTAFLKLAADPRWQAILVDTISFMLTVNGGSGSGNYAFGTKVTIKANKPSPGKIFDAWTGSTSEISDINDSVTYITMTDSNITVNSSYKKVTSIQDNAGGNSVNCYPNPAISCIHIGNCSSFDYAVIYSITGENLINKNIRGENKITINIENLTPGLYIIRIYNSTGEPKMMLFNKAVK